jgi:hypothetical protein
VGDSVAKTALEPGAVADRVEEELDDRVASEEVVAVAVVEEEQQTIDCSSVECSRHCWE